MKEATRQTTPTGQQSNLGSQNKRVQVSQNVREKTESLNKRSILNMANVTPQTFNRIM